MNILDKIAKLIGIAKQDVKGPDLEQRQVTCFEIPKKVETKEYPNPDIEVKDSIKKLQHAVQDLEQKKRNFNRNYTPHKYDNRKKDFRNPPK